MFDFFTVHTLKVHKTSVHNTLFSGFSGLVCMACAHHRVHISGSCMVSLEISCQDLLKIAHLMNFSTGINSQESKHARYFEAH